MDMDRNKSFSKNLLKQLGQSTVEYILLMALITTVILGLLNSAPFQKIFGEDSEYFDQLGDMIEFSYRHAYLGDDDERRNDNYNYGGAIDHQSYKLEGTTRFFVPLEPYPQ